jgi:hypothetical protein
MEPPFLTLPWDDDEFPMVANDNLVPANEWEHNDLPTSGCYTAQEWMRWAMSKPLCSRPSWVIPSRLYTYARPELCKSPEDPEGFFRQQIITNTFNNRRNEFAEPLRKDLVLYNKTSIPLVPTGRPMDIEMGYMIDMIFTEDCAVVSIQLKDRTDKRLIKLDLWITDAEINIRAAVNHRRTNHIYNDYNEPGSEEDGHWWDME